MKVLLTGATGYIGHQLAIKLAKLDHIVHALVRDVNSSRLPIHKNIIPFKGDICDLDSIMKAIKGCQQVFHTAAFTNMRCNNIEPFYKTNVIGTRNILEASYQNAIKKVIHTSTLAVFGPALYHVPITERQPRLNSYSNDYELTKQMGEEEVFKYVKKGLNCSILNVSKVYGPGPKTFSNGVNPIIERIMKDMILYVPDRLNVEANYVFIDDVVNAELLAAEKARPGEKYIIGGENIDYNSLFETIKKLSKSKIPVVKVNYQVVKGIVGFITNVSRLFGKEPLVTPTVLDFLFTNRSASSQKAISSLNYSITPLNIGLKNTINYLK